VAQQVERIKLISGNSEFGENLLTGEVNTLKQSEMAVCAESLAKIGSVEAKYYREMDPSTQQEFLRNLGNARNW